MLPSYAKTLVRQTLAANYLYYLIHQDCLDLQTGKLERRAEEEEAELVVVDAENCISEQSTKNHDSNTA